ncbi:LD-carboxypeptidase [Clostridium nigeriense]|uniref:S66 peptidase family protein n=1 Tax=Clostridium nigeriense TaxID=1805470 RepID=UPI00082A382E|nr:LD-carboxypeptidase [Clostridium nigeriense]
MSILKENDTIGLISCSNGLSNDTKEKVNTLTDLLYSLNLNVVISKALYKNSNNNTEDEKFRANELMNLYNNKNIKAIFDLSGGDLCNEILDYLNYDIILNSNIPFIGYSDLTVILNSLYTKTNSINFNYQLRNLIREDSENQIKYFKEVFFKDTDMLREVNYKFIRGNYMEGTLIGGNIRCFLKLAGTEYMPSFENKILFLEALSGDINKISTFITQYKQIGAFSKIKGLILGTFTEFEKTYDELELEKLILNKLKDYDFSIIKTSDLGHGPNSKAVPIGKRIILK